MTENTTFEQCVRKSYPTGSRYICNPPVMNTDKDTVILVEGYHDWADLLIRDGWQDCGAYDQGADFRAFRKGENNYIITENDEFYQAYVTATDVCKDLNLSYKEERIRVFQRMLTTHSGYQGLTNWGRPPEEQVAFEVFDGVPVAMVDDHPMLLRPIFFQGAA